jgi:hypothetical protein
MITRSVAKRKSARVNVKKKDLTPFFRKPHVNMHPEVTDITKILLTKGLSSAISMSLKRRTWSITLDQVS